MSRKSKINISTKYTTGTSNTGIGIIYSNNFTTGTTPNYTYKEVNLIKICMKCKKEFIKLGFTYSRLGNERNICNNCMTKFLDKLFELSINHELEDSLFKKKEGDSQ